MSEINRTLLQFFEMNSDTLCSLTQLMLNWLKKKSTVNSKMLKLSHGLTISSNDFITESGQLFVGRACFCWLLAIIGGNPSF